MYNITTDRSLIRGRHAQAAHVAVLEASGVAVAWMTVDESATCPPRLLGSLPATELVVSSFTADDDVPDEPLIGLVAKILELAESPTAEYVRYRINPELVSHAERHRRIVTEAGMALFQEKEGLHLDLTTWVPPGPAAARLEFRSLDDVGDAAFTPVIASVGFGTLDRNDAWFHERAGAANWGEVFLSMCGADDRKSWILAYDRRRVPVGFIGVNRMPIESPTPWDIESTGTIAMTGVVPDHRGRGYIEQILAAGLEAAASRGFEAMLDSVDVENAPMLSAMAEQGYLTDHRPWHDWYYRAPVDR